jgi:NAD(P)-dependent dehydrogenase (short-subunit alcohol dehydrogenase family)
MRGAPAGQDKSMSMKFSGQVALVTGAASGMGRATAEAFAAEGLKVVVSDVNVEGGNETVALIRAAGGEASFVQCNVASDAEVKALVGQSVATYGRLDYAFNNAGVDRETCRLAAVTEAQFDFVSDVNFKGVWLCMKYQLEVMLAQNFGAIVNTASVLGLRGFAEQSVYSATKHAVVGLTKSAAIGYAKKGIRVNAVCPGGIETAMVKPHLDADPELRKRLTGAHPIGRLGQSEEIASAVLYLCCDGASFVTGQSLAVDGGLTAA